MTKATRERKIRFMEGFGTNALRTAITEAFYKYGSGWLTDEQLDEIVEDQIADYRDIQRRNRSNRKIAADRAIQKIKELHESAAELQANGMRCNCDLDNWQPEISTGHSWVCRIHKAAKERARA